MDKETFKRRREKLGLTQEELAKRLGASRATINRYENGRTRITQAVEMALKLIEAQERK